MWSLLRLGEWKIAKMVTVHWPRWLPCPYMVKTLKNLLLQNQISPGALSLHKSSGTGDLQKILKWWSYIDIWPFYGKIKFASQCTKLKVYWSMVLPTLLYACKTWTVYQRHAKRLNHFHTSCLRKLLKIKWQDRIPDTEVLKRAGMQSVHTLLKLAQLRWTGHVTRMPDEHLPKKILYGELQAEKRSHGGQKKRYKDTLKASFKDLNIPTESWEQIAQDRTKWRGLIRRGAGE